MHCRNINVGLNCKWKFVCWIVHTSISNKITIKTPINQNVQKVPLDISCHNTLFILVADFMTVVQATAQTESAVVLKRLQLNTMKTEQKYPRVACSGQEGPIWRAGAMQCVWLSSHRNSRLHWTLTSRPSWPGRAGPCVYECVCLRTHTVHEQEQRHARSQAESEETNIHVVCVDEVHTRSHTCFLQHTPTPDFMSSISLK